MVATLVAQFLSALADNALLFAAIALVRKDGYPAWSGPLLQEFFVAAYIVLAPFVGVFADARPKGQVMLLANLVKFAGALGMCLSINPFLSYAVVGTGAAAYSPAKYGILGELASPQHLVKANGLLEASTIAAILLGAVLGGLLADWSVEGALIAITAGYAAAALSAVLIPRLKRPVKLESFSLTKSIRDFGAQTRALWHRRNARLALIGTSMFWGAGAALRFLVIAWVPVALKVTNNRLPGFLTGMVAAGIVVGAALAARFVKLESVKRALPAGILIGVGVCFLPLASTLPLAYAVMACVGISSGFFVVPLDALLQREGETSVGVGASIAIQTCARTCACWRWSRATRSPPSQEYRSMRSRWALVYSSPPRSARSPSGAIQPINGNESRRRRIHASCAGSSSDDDRDRSSSRGVQSHTPSTWPVVPTPARSARAALRLS